MSVKLLPCGSVVFAVQIAAILVVIGVRTLSHARNVTLPYAP